MIKRRHIQLAGHGVVKDGATINRRYIICRENLNAPDLCVYFTGRLDVIEIEQNNYALIGAVTLFAAEALKVNHWVSAMHLSQMLNSNGSGATANWCYKVVKTQTKERKNGSPIKTRTSGWRRQPDIPDSNNSHRP